MGFHCCGRLMSILGGRRFALGYIRPSEKEEAIYSTVHFKRGKDKRATFFSYCTLRVKNVDTNQTLRLSDRQEGACEIRLYQDEVFSKIINMSCNLQKFQEGWAIYLLS